MHGLSNARMRTQTVVDTNVGRVCFINDTMGQEGCKRPHLCLVNKLLNQLGCMMAHRKGVGKNHGILCSVEHVENAVNKGVLVGLCQNSLVTRCKRQWYRERIGRYQWVNHINGNVNVAWERLLVDFGNDAVDL